MSCNYVFKDPNWLGCARPVVPGTDRCYVHQIKQIEACRKGVHCVCYAWEYEQCCTCGLLDQPGVVREAEVAANVV